MFKTCFLLFFLLCSGLSFSQSTDSASTWNGKTLLAKQWKLSSIAGPANRINVPENEANSITFKSDGTYATHSKRFKKVKGTWVYDEPTKTLLLTRKKQSVYKVIQLSPTELIMEGDATEKHLRYIYIAL